MQQDLISAIKALYADPQYNFLILSIFFPVALSAWKNVLARHVHDRLDLWLDHGAALTIYACFGTFKLVITTVLSLDKWQVKISQDILVLLIPYFLILVPIILIVKRLYHSPKDGRKRLWRLRKYLGGNFLGGASVYMLSFIYSLVPN